VANSLRYARHSTALRVRQQCRQLVLEVEDDGQTVPPASRPGMGRRSMHQRAHLLHGTLEAGPGPMGGFSVRLSMPLG
jgi:signal transduction histidine kinase